MSTEPDYDRVYSRIARTLERLCAECGFQNVLCVFSSDMPSHRRERERLDVTRLERKDQRKHRNRLAKERKRRELGAKPQSQSLSRIKPWEELNMSRSKWYRKRNEAIAD